MTTPEPFELPKPYSYVCHRTPRLVLHEGRYHCCLLEFDVGGMYLIDLLNGEVNHWADECLAFLNSSFKNFVECFKVFNNSGAHVSSTEKLTLFETIERDTMWVMALEGDLFYEGFLGMTLERKMMLDLVPDFFWRSPGTDHFYRRGF
jgi:hypothetical protein